ncbi:MAG TPA: VOC family protein [Caulobacteraceae bacterium]|nr:VOC family protein [Caulobacteraceae bacterium]
MKIKALGHVVLRVTDRARAERFYGGVLGLPVCARYDEGGYRMTFFSLGNHHDFAILEVGGGVREEQAAGLHHVAFNIGADLGDLRDAKAALDAAGVACNPVDHEVTKSLYFDDPDGNGVELYIDASDSWRRDPQRVAQMAPLEL